MGVGMVTRFSILCILLPSAIPSLTASEAPEYPRDWSACSPGCTCQPSTLSVQCRGLVEWERVMTTLPTDVRHLDLQFSRLTHIDSTTLSNFSSLESLDLGNNEIHSISTQAFANLLHLDRISLTANRLQEMRYDWFSNNTDLQYVDLSMNNISQVLVAWEETSNTTSSQLTLFQLTYIDISHNQLSHLPTSFLHTAPRLHSLNASYNLLNDLNFIRSAPEEHPLRALSLEHNSISGTMSKHMFAALPHLTELQLSYNDITKLDEEWLGEQPQLQQLQFTHNPLSFIANFAFSNAVHMETLALSNLPNMTFIADHTFTGLPNLTSLDLSNNAQLEFIHPRGFDDLPRLTKLDLSNNRLSILYPLSFYNESRLESFDVTGNPWVCDCEAQKLVLTSQLLHKSQVICFYPLHLRGVALGNVEAGNLTCTAAQVLNVTSLSRGPIGSSLVLDCPVTGDPRPAVTWITNHRVQLEHEAVYVDHSQLDPEHLLFHEGHDWHLATGYLPSHEFSHQRVKVLKNGSLYIDYLTRRDAGFFRCLVVNEFGNDSAIMEVQLDYSVLYYIKIKSIVFGLVCATSFLSISVVISAIRFCAFFFGEEERKKRKSIKEVLDVISDYKSDKFDKLSAFKTAKIDQLSAYKSAKMGQLTAYKSAKIDRIRTYKQVTVTNIYHHLQSLREHYNSQVTRIKDNCAQQVDKVHENYSNRVGKLKDYKSHQTVRIRDHYNAQADRVREYSSQQMQRLREQYKLQQQHFIKLLELLDMGNCMTVIEAECIRTDPMNLEQDINFEVGGGQELMYESADSEYLTAGSSSERSSVISAPYTLSNHHGDTEASSTPSHFKRNEQSSHLEDEIVLEPGDECDTNKEEAQGIPATDGPILTRSSSNETMTLANETKPIEVVILLESEDDTVLDTSPTRETIV